MMKMPNAPKPDGHHDNPVDAGDEPAPVMGKALPETADTACVHTRRRLAGTTGAERNNEHGKQRREKSRHSALINETAWMPKRAT